MLAERLKELITLRMKEKPNSNVEHARKGFEKYFFLSTVDKKLELTQKLNAVAWIKMRQLDSFHAMMCEMFDKGSSLH